MNLIREWPATSATLLLGVAVVVLAAVFGGWTW